MAYPTSRSQQAERHRALADPSRLAILRILEGAETPLDARALAELVGLHVSTVRWHLTILRDATLVAETPESSGMRGRPRHGYTIVPGALDNHPGGFRLLADVLAEVLVRGGDPATVEAIGRERGYALIADRAKPLPATSAGAVRAVVRLLEQFGFRPRLRRTRQGQRIDMHPCPFGDVAVKYSTVVCPLHLGLMRGAFDRLGGTVETTTLEAFVEPNLCIARLTTRRQSKR